MLNASELLTTNENELELHCEMEFISIAAACTITKNANGHLENHKLCSCNTTSCKPVAPTNSASQVIMTIATGYSKVRTTGIRPTSVAGSVVIVFAFLLLSGV